VTSKAQRFADVFAARKLECEAEGGREASESLRNTCRILTFLAAKTP